MQSSRESGSILVRFLDSFLQEQNIKWILSVGMLILLGSTLRLVSMHWTEYTPFWKYGILLAYTGGIFAASQISYFRMGLHRTGTLLMALTVMMVPITFLALHWIRPTRSFEFSDLGTQIELAVLLGVNLVLSGISTHRVFVHFFRKPQPTFQFAYLALSLAGAVLPGLPHSWSPGILTVLWLLFAAGTLKVNRHVFWLIEEERQPRVFGFFPIALLGTQFLGLFAINLAEHMPVQWWGLACGLVAVPVLLTADTVARVFQQRTGDLIRPLPQCIIVPLVTGLILTATGLCLAMTELPRPYAIVPTAALAAIALGVVAHRTQYQGFAWAGIGCVLLAYQFFPLFFLEFARMVVHSGAAAVQESKLPYAFYGLTYLPVLLVFTGASVLLRRRRQEVFAIPLRNAAICLTSLLLLVAFGHSKATFPVCLSMLAVLGLQTVAFADRRLLIPANLALLGAAWGFPSFAAVVLPATSISMSSLLCCSIAAALQLVPGRWIDRWSLQLDSPDDPSRVSPRINQLFSFVVTVFAGMNWCMHAISAAGTAPPLLTNLILGSLLAAHTLLWLEPGLGLATLIFLNLSIFLHWISCGFRIDTSLLFFTSFWLAQWIIGSGLMKWPQARVSQLFAKPMRNLSGTLLGGMVLLVVCPRLYFCHCFRLGDISILWMISAMLIVWCFAATWQTHRTLFAVSGLFVSLGASSAFLMQHYGFAAVGEWLPLIWTSVSLALWGCARIADSQLSNSQLTESGVKVSSPGMKPFRAFETVVPGILFCVLFGTLFILGWPARIAACLATAGLFCQRREGAAFISPEVVGCLANWQGLSWLISAIFGEACKVQMLLQYEMQAFVLPIALFAALSILGIEALLCFRIPRHLQLVQGHRALLGIVCVAMLAFPFEVRASSLSFQEMTLVLTFVGLAASQLVRACREQSVESVWIAQLIAAVAVGYLAAFRVIDLSHCWGMYAPLALSLVLWSMGQFVAGRDRFQIMTRPFQMTAFWLPMLAVAVGVSRHCLDIPATWKGFNSLALLFSAAFYFWQGLELQRKQYWVLSAVIVNLALALLWRELHWHDAQLFMIPLGASILLLTEALYREIPKALHDPLRYAGALTILVSPTFEIVGGSWLHLLSLMIAAVVIVLLAIGIRVRALVYTGTAFLVADLIATVIRGSLDHPNLLWSAGVALGTGVIALAAYCEHHRESLMSRIRFMSAELETWK